MSQKLLPAIALAAVFFSCGNETDNSTEKTADSVKQTKEIVTDSSSYYKTLLAKEAKCAADSLYYISKEDIAGPLHPSHSYDQGLLGAYLDLQEGGEVHCADPAQKYQVSQTTIKCGTWLYENNILTLDLGNQKSQYFICSFGHQRAWVLLDLKTRKIDYYGYIEGC